MLLLSLCMFALHAVNHVYDQHFTVCLKHLISDISPSLRLPIHGYPRLLGGCQSVGLSVLPTTRLSETTTQPPDLSAAHSLHKKKAFLHMWAEIFTM